MVPEPLVADLEFVDCVDYFPVVPLFEVLWAIDGSVADEVFDADFHAVEFGSYSGCFAFLVDVVDFVFDGL